MTSLLALFLAILGLSLAQAQSNSSNTFANPIIASGADPWVLKHEGAYYMTYTNFGNITILKSPSLTDWEDAEIKAVFVPPVGDAKGSSCCKPLTCSPAGRGILHQSVGPRTALHGFAMVQCVRRRRLSRTISLHWVIVIFTADPNNDSPPPETESMYAQSSFRHRDCSTSRRYHLKNDLFRR